MSEETLEKPINTTKTPVEPQGHDKSKAKKATEQQRKANNPVAKTKPGTEKKQPKPTHVQAANKKNGGKPTADKKSTDTDPTTKSAQQEPAPKPVNKNTSGQIKVPEKKSSPKKDDGAKPNNKQQTEGKSEPKAKPTPNKNKTSLKPSSLLEKNNKLLSEASKTFNKATKRRFKRLVKVSRKSSFITLVAIPWLLAAVYYLFFAANFYVSSTSFMIKEASSQTANAAAGLPLAAIAGFSAQSDEHILHDHIVSTGMLQHLDKALSLKQHFSQYPDADWLSRLSEDASQEDFLAYYQDLLTINYNELSGLLTIEVKSYDPVYSQALLKAILQQSENLVNTKSRQLAKAQLDFVQDEIQASADRLVQARKALIGFQDSNKLFNPEHQGETVAGIISSLESELARTEAERRQLLTYQRINSPHVVALDGKINSLKDQIAHENTRLVNTDNTSQQTLNAVYGQYKELELEVEVAQTTYLSALTSLESARIEASRQLKYLLIINEPFVAEEALYPRKLYNLTTIAVILLLIFGIFRMVATTIREHLD